MRLQRFEHSIAVQHVLFHLLPFVGIERTALPQNLLGNAHFTDIVQQRAKPDLADLLFLQPQ